jgi:hypothetical protein
MLAVDFQQSTLEQALVFFQKHLESQREQQENNLPRNGKAPATAEDLSIDRAFEEKLQAIAGLLSSTNETPEQTTQQIKTPPIPPAPPRVQPVKPKILDEFETEPYINPFTGQLITPNTPFTAGSSNSHINANLSFPERHEPHIRDHAQQQQTSAVLQQSLPPTPKPGSARKEAFAEPDVGRSRPPSYRSVESVRSFDTRSTVPAARSYASQPAVSEAVPISRPRWGTMSRLKHMSSKAPFKAWSKTQSEGVQNDDVCNAYPEIHHAAITERSPVDSPATTTDKANSGKSRQSLDQHLQAKGLDPITKNGQTTFLKNIQGSRRYGSLAPSNPTTIEREPTAPYVTPHEPSRSSSDIPNGNQLERRQSDATAHTPPKSIYKPLAPELHTKGPPPPVQYTRISPVQSHSAAPAHQEATQTIREDDARAKKSLQVASEPARSLPPFQASLGWTEQMAGERPDFSDNLAEFNLDEASLKLAFELSGGFPQDYSSLKQIQEEHEISAQILESERLAKELAGGSPQDYAAFTGLRAEKESTLERLRLAEIERQADLEADWKLAQSLAAKDVPQHFQEFHRADGQRQLDLQEEARLAKEVAEREDRAEREAQLATARRLQEEWNASEASHITEQQRQAQELSEGEDRLEYERRNAELQRLQAEWDHPEPTQITNHSIGTSGFSFDADTGTGDRPPAYTFQPEPERQRNPNPGTRQSPPQQQAPTKSSSNGEAEELARIIAERRARHGQWQADVQKANQAAREAEEANRRRAREHEEEIRRLEQEQRALAERTRKEEEAGRAAIEAERRARRAECTVCGEEVDKSEMAVLPCKHAYCGGCIARKSPHVPVHMIPLPANRNLQSPSSTLSRPRSHSNAAATKSPWTPPPASCPPPSPPRTKTSSSNSPPRAQPTVPTRRARPSSLPPASKPTRQPVPAAAPIPARRAEAANTRASSVRVTSTA